MPRHAESEADIRLRAALADEGLTVSRYQLERWRQLGLLSRPKVIRAGFGGSSVADHGQDTLAAAALLAQESRRGRPWQHVAQVMFAHGYPLGERCLRGSCAHIIDRPQSRLRSYWDEAVAMTPLKGDDPDDQVHLIAESAVSIIQERRSMRPLLSYIREEVKGTLPSGDRGERQEAVHTAMIYRILDIVRPGSLTEEERYLAITGQSSGETQEVTPLLPSDIATVARTITLREARSMRSWLLAAWNTGLLQPNSKTSLLEDVLINVTQLRLMEQRHPLDQAVPFRVVKDLDEYAEDLRREFDDGLVPGQLSFDGSGESL